MSTTITRTSDAATTTPTQVLGYAALLEGRNVVSDLIGGGIAVTLIPQRMRSGTLELLYADRAEAWAAVELHRGTDTFTLDDTDVPEVGMLYTANTIAPALEDQTRALWIVSIEYQEIEP